MRRYRRVRITAQASNTRVCEAYTFMNAEVVKPPDSGDAVLQLKKYIAKVGLRTSPIHA